MAQFGEHLLPPALTSALHRLESTTEALPWEELQPQLQASLGARRCEELVVEPEALAAASLAQVHLATTAHVDGGPIVLKILYPGLRASIDTDFDTVIRMLRLGRWLHHNRQLDQWLSSMRDQLHQECDYAREAAAMSDVATLVGRLEQQSPFMDKGLLRVPNVIQRYTRDEVLGQEFLSGCSVADHQVARLSLARRNRLAKAMLELFFAEVFDWGLVQTDPNFGNYLIHIGADAESDQLIMLDFGSVSRMDHEFAEHLRVAVAAGLASDLDRLITAVVGLGCVELGSDASAKLSFAEFCMNILEPLRPVADLPAGCLDGRKQYDWAKSQLIKRAGKQAANASLHQHFALPGAEFTLIARKLIGVFTFISVLGARFNGHTIAKHYIDRWEAKNHSGSF